MSSETFQPGDQVICINQELHDSIYQICFSDLFVKEVYPEKKKILIDLAGIDVIFDAVDFRKVESI